MHIAIQKKVHKRHRLYAFYESAQDAKKAIAILIMLHFRNSILNASIILNVIRSSSEVNVKHLALYEKGYHGLDPQFFGMISNLTKLKILFLKRKRRQERKWNSAKRM